MPWPGVARATGDLTCQTSERRADPWDVPLPSLFINRDADYDWLIALEHGRVCDGHPPTQFRGVTDACAYMVERPGGRRIIGFVVQALRGFVPPQRLFAPPHFEAP